MRHDMNQVQIINRYFELSAEAEAKGLVLRVNREAFTLRLAKTHQQVVVSGRLSDISKTIKTYVVDTK